MAMTRALAICATSLLAGVAGCAASAVPVTVTTGHPTAASPHTRAAADAAQIVGSFVPPTGATRLGGPPAGPAAKALAQPPSLPEDPDVAYDHDFWVVSGQPQAVLADAAVGVPSRFTATGNGSAGPVNSPTMWFDSFSLADATMYISVAAAGTRRTVIRVDAEVTWTPAKPAAERIPASVVTITVTGYPGLDPARGETTRSAVVSDGATVREIRTLVDGLGLAPAGMFSCPSDSGRSLRLVFRSARGTELAVLGVPVTGCPFISITVGGASLPSLNGEGFADQVLSVADLHWAHY